MGRHRDISRSYCRPATGHFSDLVSPADAKRCWIRSCCGSYPITHSPTNPNRSATNRSTGPPHGHTRTANANANASPTD